ncbi:nucleotidyltransferase domain-containing protein [Candidatus Falkowbacteria bacterium]|jgi:uncharacterized protein|nr:nucleotidyltransferase domain-containing protein [Candidatus Falkowbacteria bacterium]MBT4433370.1 nucleotidyltransferase domain-containing protein [Candidatus Falkowbacteria bacterium]
MVTKKQKDINKITEKIVKKYKPEKIILFGSYAWGTPGPDSDVDLFVVKNTKNARKTARNIDGDIFPRLFPIDLIVSTPKQIESGIEKDNFFIKKVMTMGKILYAKK